MRALGLTTLVTLLLLAGCSEGTAAPTDPAIAARTAIVPEERSTCAALARVDLAVVDTDPTSLERDADALDRAVPRAPADVRPALGSLAGAYRDAAQAPETASMVPTERAATDIVGWFNTHCGGAR